MNKQKFNQASWNYPEETEILVIAKPNKQKIDWEKTFDKTFLNIRFDTTVGTSINIKDFISNLLQQQREDFKQTMANSNEWWNNKLRQQREEIIKEIEGIVGGDTGRTGQVYFYKKQLRKQIREILKQI